MRMTRGFEQMRIKQQIKRQRTIPRTRLALHLGREQLIRIETMHDSDGSSSGIDPSQIFGTIVLTHCGQSSQGKPVKTLLSVSI
jgi:hypothetical protein